MTITKKLISVNYTKGRNGKSPIRVTFHTAVSGSDSLYTWFNNPNAKASAHYYVNKYGTVEQYVEESDTAWANANWDSNIRSITIETWDNGTPADSTRTNEMYESCSQLLANIIKRYGIPNVFLSKEQALNFNNKGLDKHAYYASRSCFAGLDINRIINRTNNILNTNPMPAIDDQVRNTMQNLVGHDVSDAEAIHETERMHTAYNNDIGFWYKEFYKGSKEAQNFRIGRVNEQIARQQQKIIELENKIVELNKQLELKDRQISSLTLALTNANIKVDTLTIEMEKQEDLIENLNAENAKLKEDLNTCQTQTQKPDITFNFLGLNFIINKIGKRPTEETK